MTPLGHLAIGYLVSHIEREEVRQTRLAGYLIGSVWPDMDFMLVPLSSRLYAHRVPTHSITAAVFAGFATRHALDFWPVFWGTVFHSAADDLWGSGDLPGVGWLFPLCTRRISLLPTIRWPERVGGRAIPRRLSAILFGEFPLIAAALFVWLLKRSDRP